MTDVSKNEQQVRQNLTSKAFSKIATRGREGFETAEANEIREV